MALVEVQARDMRPGDILCIQVDREDVSPLSTMNAWRLQSRAFRLAWEQRAISDGYENTPRVLHMFSKNSYRVEHVSYGLFKARVVFSGGVAVRFPRNAWVAVFRKEGQ